MLILPYLEAEELYGQFHLDEPWDSPHNLSLLPQMPTVYQAMNYPADETNPRESSTFYQAVTGNGTAFEGAEGLSFATDFHGTANTIMVIEGGRPVPWTQPADLEVEGNQPLPPLGGVFTGNGRFSLFGPSRVKGMNALFADGHVEFISAGVHAAKLRRAFDRNNDQLFNASE